MVPAGFALTMPSITGGRFTLGPGRGIAPLQDAYGIGRITTIGDHPPEALRLKKSVGRLGTYLQGYGDLLVRTNGWDAQVLRWYLADPVISSVGGAHDAVGTPRAASARGNPHPSGMAGAKHDR